MINLFFSPTGVGRVRKVCGKFNGMIRELTKGVEEISSQVDTNMDIIRTLQLKNNNLSLSMKEAENLIAGLSKLVKGE